MANSKKNKLTGIFHTHILQREYDKSTRIEYHFGGSEWEASWNKNDKGSFAEFDFVFLETVGKQTIAVVDFVGAGESFKNTLKKLDKKLSDVALPLGFIFDGEDFYMLNKGKGEFIKEFPPLNNY